MEEQKSITILGETDFRNQQTKFGVRQKDRRQHVYIIGKTGTGKTTLLQNMAAQDIMAGHGLCFVDPHGECAERLLDFVPAERTNDVIYFDPSDLNYPIAFNAIEGVEVERRHLLASGLMGVFKKIWPDVWSARMEYILNNTILALLEYPGSTLLAINRMLSDQDYRDKVVDRLADPMVKAFWRNEFSRYHDRFQVEAIAPIQNKVGQFISVPLVRNIVGQTKSAFNIRKIMDEGKILILNLSKGKIGEDNSRLLGALLVTELQIAAMSRVDVPEEQRRDFYLYVDEFQNFATESFASILSEARKYRLNLVLAHQYITQMDETVRDAVFGNVGTLACFRVGADDAEFLEKEFQPEFYADDLVNLDFAQIYLRLMIDGLASRPFSAHTLPPLIAPSTSQKEKILRVSQERYGSDRKMVENKIQKWSAPMEEKSTQPAVRKTASSEGKDIYETKCSVCGKRTFVSFEPDGARPIYCKKCLKHSKKDQELKQGDAKPESAQLTAAASLKNAGQNNIVEFNEHYGQNHEPRKRKEPDLSALHKAIKDAKTNN